MVERQKCDLRFELATGMKGDANLRYIHLDVYYDRVSIMHTNMRVLHTYAFASTSSPLQGTPTPLSQVLQPPSPRYSSSMVPSITRTQLYSFYICNP
jgi:hypothetical protein